MYKVIDKAVIVPITIIAILKKLNLNNKTQIKIGKIVKINCGLIPKENLMPY